MDLHITDRIFKNQSTIRKKKKWKKNKKRIGMREMNKESGAVFSREAAPCM